MSVLKIKQLKGPNGSNQGAVVVYDTAGYPQWTSDIHSGVLLPTGPSSSRPSSPSVGTVRYNTDTSQFEGYAGSAWGPLGSSGVKLQQFGGTSTTGESTINFTSTSLNVQGGVNGTYVNNIITVSDQGSGLAQVNIMPQLFRVRLKLNYSTSSPYVPIWTKPITPVSGWSIPSGWSLIQIPSGLSNDIQFMFGSGWVYPYVSFSMFGNATGANPPSGNSATHAWGQRAITASTWDPIWYDNDTTVLQFTNATVNGAGGANGTPNVILDLWFANFN